MKLLPPELSLALVPPAVGSHGWALAACSSRPSHPSLRLPLISWPSPTSFSAFYPSVSPLPFSLYPLLSSLPFLLTSFDYVPACPLPHLSSKACLHLSHFSLSRPTSLCLLTVCLSSGCTFGSWSVQGGPVGDPSLLRRQRQTQPSPNKQALLWAAARAFGIP